MADSKSFKKMIQRQMLSLGPVWKGGSWYIVGDGTMVVVDPQKSDWSNRYYLNLAVHLNELGDEKYPKEHRCHVGVRAERVADGLEDALDLESSLSDEDRETIIRDAFSTSVMPLILAWRSVEGVKASLPQLAGRNAAVMLVAKKHLNLA